MQLKIQRSQRLGGLAGNTAFFCLDVRADYSPEERGNIAKYRLGGQLVYDSPVARKRREQASAHLGRTQAGGTGERAAGFAHGLFSLAMSKLNLNITIDSLGRGHHIECKDLNELLEAEDTVREACKGVTRYLEIATTFDGSEVVIDYDKGEEHAHVASAAVPLFADAPAARASAAGTDEAYDFETVQAPANKAFNVADLEQRLASVWDNPRTRPWAIVAFGIAAAIVLYFKLR